MTNTIRILWRTFKNYRRYVVALVLLGFLSAILEGIGINATVPLLSFLLGVSTGPTDIISRSIEVFFGILHVPFSFRYLIAFILLLFIMRAFSSTLFGYIRGYIGADYFASESRTMMNRALRASWPYLLGQKMGTLQNILVRDIQQTSSLLDVTSQVIQSFSGFLIYLLVALNISPTTTLAVIGGGIVLLVLVRPFIRRIQHISTEQVGLEKDISKFISEQIIGMKTLKAAGVERAIVQYGESFIERQRKLQVRIALTKSLSTSLFQPFTVGFIVVVFIVSYKSPGFSAVGFIATLYLIQKMFAYLESGQNALHSISQLVPYAATVTQYRKTLGEHKEQQEQTTAPFIFNDHIRFENVSLEYSPGEPAVHNISLELKRGEMFALIGPSGAGKTTIADLLLRLFKPTSGTITVDGVSSRDIGLEDWRSRMGYVSQDVFLFNGTIEDNVRFYRHDLTEAALETAAKQANAYEFIMSLKDGFKTVVGDRGMTLSGGQRQRIALARALAGRPDVLVLDEATSALDTESEQAIQGAIRGLHGQVAVFVIAHRLSTIEHADTIAVVEKGKIVERGSPSDLRANPDSYFARHRG